MVRVLAWIVVLWLAACGRFGVEAVGPPGDDDGPAVGSCPLVLHVDPGKVTGQLVDFPLLVRLGSELADRTQLQQDARNLAFHVDGVPMAYEIEDPAGPVLAWVRVPVLSESGLTIRVGYGAGTAPSASQLVWSPAYAAVFHLAERSGAPHDATGHYAEASIVEIGPPPTDAAAGQIGRGRTFQSMRNHAVQINALDLMYSPFTVSGWMSEHTLMPGYHALVAREHARAADNFFWIGRHDAGYVGEVYRAGGGKILVSNKSGAIDTWVHLALTATSMDAASQATLFINGAEDVSQSVNGLPSPGDERAIVLGADNNLGGMQPDADWLDGVLDEVRIETVARSPEWVRADYLSMNDQLIRYEVLPAAVPCDAPGE